jgi:hypothetical protein
MRANRESSERRNSNRFPLERDILFRVLTKRGDPECGIGRTVNMSSSGVLFSSERELTPGKVVEVAIHWPAQLDNTTPLKLVGRGRVVRSDTGQVAIEIQNYEFRILGSQGLSLPQQHH